MEPELREIRDFLAAHAPFDALPPEVLAGLPRECTIRYHRRGTVILDVGEYGDGLYVVRSGAVDITDETGGLLMRVAAGRAFGMSTLLEDRPARHRCEAIEDTLLIVLSPEAFERLVQAHPLVASYYAGHHHDRLTTAIEHLQQATSGSIVLGTSVAELAGGEVISAAPTESIRDAARRMTESKVSCLAVVEDGELVGILTDRDLRSRVLAEGIDPDRPVSRAMTPSPATLPEDSLAFEALLEMAARNIHHLPLVDPRGRPTGIVTTSDLIRLAQSNPVFLAADIARQPTVEGVAEQARRIPAVLGGLVAQDATAADLGRITTALGDAVRRRVLALAEADLPPAPTTWSWVVLGSAARDEEGLAADQDHALVVGADGHDDWFAELAERVVSGLERCGWPRCSGEMMATNPRWRMTVPGWRRQFTRWAHEPDQEALLHVATFYDLRHLGGDPELTSAVWGHRPVSPALIAHLGAQAAQMRPPLGFFRNFVLEQEGDHRDTLDIKRGIAGVVQVARIHALRVGSDALSTRDRITAAERANLLGAGEADDLRDALELMSYRRLLHQLDQVREGREPDNHLDPRTLNERQRRHLRDAFSIVRSAQQQLAQAVGASHLA